MLIGVTWPKEQPGYWLGPARRSLRESSKCSDLDDMRRHPATGEAVCHLGQYASVRGDASLECLPTGDATEDELYACTTGLELYECPAEDACEGGGFQPHPVEYVDHVDTWLHARRLDADGPPTRRLDVAGVNSTCRVGHMGVLCAQCEPGFVLNKQMLCDECPESNTIVYLVAAVVLCGLVAVYTYIDGGVSGDDDEIKTPSKARCSKCRCLCCKRVPTQSTQRRSKMPRTPTFAQYINALVKGMIEQPDKVMLLVSFAQIMSEFSQTYEVQWPSSLTQAFDVRSSAIPGCHPCATARAFLDLT